MHTPARRQGDTTAKLKKLSLRACNGSLPESPLIDTRHSTEFNVVKSHQMALRSIVFILIYIGIRSTLFVNIILKQNTVLVCVGAVFPERYTRQNVTYRNQLVGII